MPRPRLDAIAWLVVGVSMVSQGLFVATFAWWPEGAGARADGAIPVPVASAVVSAAFVVSGLGALYLGVRRFTAARRAR